MREFSLDSKTTSNISLAFSVISAASMLLYSVSIIIVYIVLIYFNSLADGILYTSLYGYIVVFSLGGIGGICGIIFGSISIKKEKRGKPLVGIILGGVNILVSILVLMIIPGFFP